MIQQLLENPAQAICIVFAAWILAKVFKLSAKVVKRVLQIGIVYIILNFICSM